MLTVTFNINFITKKNVCFGDHRGKNKNVLVK